jgi:hypothetical protein
MIANWLDLFRYTTGSIDDMHGQGRPGQKRARPGQGNKNNVRGHTILFTHTHTPCTQYAHTLRFFFFVFFA